MIQLFFKILISCLLLFCLSCGGGEPSSIATEATPPSTSKNSTAKPPSDKNPISTTNEIAEEKKSTPQKESYSALEDLIKKLDGDNPPSSEEMAQLVKELAKMGQQLPHKKNRNDNVDLTDPDVLNNLILGNQKSQADAFEDAMENGPLHIPDEMKPMFKEIIKQRRIEEARAKKMTKEEQAIAAKIPDPQKMLHNEDEAKAALAQIEQVDIDEMLKDNSNSREFKIRLRNVKKKARQANNLLRQGKMAKKNFQRKNPNANFGDDAGKIYMSDQGKVVYLPLGDASFADEVIDYRKQDDVSFPMERTLGPPDVEGSAGIANLGIKGQLTVKFTNNALVDVNGPDLFIFEIEKIEPTKLEISKDGKLWIEVGEIKGGTAEVDIAKFAEPHTPYYYVRLTDLDTRSALPGADIDAIAAIGAAMVLQLNSEVLFDFGKSTLKEEGMEAIKDLAKQLEEIKEANIIIEGHTDNVGSEAANQKLSLARAQSVSATLKEQFDSRYAFNYVEKGAGESSPVAPNDTDENRQLNRRVEILVIPK